MQKTLQLNDRFSVSLHTLPKKVTKQPNMYDLYLQFNIYDNNIHQPLPPYISTGITIPVADWKAETGKKYTAAVSQLGMFVQKAERELYRLHIDNVDELIYSIKSQVRQALTGKQPKAVKGTRRIKISAEQFTLEYVMEYHCKVKQQLDLTRVRNFENAVKNIQDFYKQQYNRELKFIYQITTDVLKEFSNWYEHSISERTQQPWANDTKVTRKSAIAALIKTALAEKWIKSNPLPDLFRGAYNEDSDKDVLDDYEQYQFLSLTEEIIEIQCSKPKKGRNKKKHFAKDAIAAWHFAKLCMFTSLGYSDLKRLNRENLKVLKTMDDNGKVSETWYIQGNRYKTGKGRFTTFLPEPIIQYFDRLQELIPGGENKLFTMPTQGMLNYWIKQLMILSGINSTDITNKEITFNNFRHTCATTWRNAGCNVDILDELMGHKAGRNRMTKRYAKATTETICKETVKYISRCKALHLLNKGASQSLRIAV